MRQKDQTWRGVDGSGATDPSVLLQRLRRDRISAVGQTAALPVGAITIAVWFVWAWKNGGLEPTQWGAFGTGLVLLLLVALAAVRVDLRLSRRRLAMFAALLAFVVWNFLSIAWADFRAEAWFGSGKTLVYAAGFFAFALWPYSARAVTGLACCYVAGVTAIGAYVLLEMVNSSDPSEFFGSGRIGPPIGYANGNVALWMSAVWPALYLGGARPLPALLRGVLLACAAVLVDLALLGESRTWLLALPLVSGLALLLARERLRLLLALVLVAAAVAPVASTVLAVYNAYFERRQFGDLVDRAVLEIAASALVLVVAGALWAAVDRRVVLGARLHRTAGATAAVLCLGVAMAGIAKGASDAGAVQRFAEQRWHEFSNPSAERGTRERRLGSSFAGYRYQELKVAWDEFVAHPLIGIGSDNYAAAYLLRRDNGRHEPRYPHSAVLRLMSQLGVIGTALFIAFAAIAVAEGLRRRRYASPLEAAAVSSLLMVFFYWWIHGAVDWFWEIPALAAPAFGALGLAAAPRAELSPERPPGAVRRRAWRSVVVSGTVVVAGAVACLALALPWLSAVYENAALRIWRSHPQLAYDRLETAGRINPLDAEPFVLEGSLALRRGETRRARSALQRAVEREPKNWYAHFQLALLAGSLGRYEEAAGYVARAAALNPMDPVVASVRGLIRRRASIDPNEINDIYLDRATRLVSR